MAGERKLLRIKAPLLFSALLLLLLPSASASQWGENLREKMSTDYLNGDPGKYGLFLSFAAAN